MKKEWSGEGEAKRKRRRSRRRESMTIRYITGVVAPKFQPAIPPPFPLSPPLFLRDASRQPREIHWR